MKNFLVWLFSPFYFNTFLPFLGEIGFVLYGGGKGGSDAPDFTQLAAASREAARLGYDLGQQQLAENKSQFDQNMAVTRPVVEAQLGLMGQTKEQGDDYFNYMKQFSRPAEMSLFYEAMGFTPDEIEQIETSRARETAAFNAAEQEKASATRQVSFDIPTYTQEMQAPAGAIKGSDLQGHERITSSTGVPAKLYQDTKSLDSIVSVAAQNEIQRLSNMQIDPNAYYLPNGDGTFSPASSSMKLVQGTQTINFDAPSGYQASSVVSTPETDALVNKLAALASERMKAQSQAERDIIDAQSRELEQRLGETNPQVYERYKNDIEAEVGQAVADSRAGFTGGLNTAARQGLRYGFSADKLAAMATQQSVQQGAMQAAAANQTRKAATETMYGRGVAEASQGLTRVNANRSMKQQDDNLQFARKLDLAGVYRGLPGASQGAYSASINAGNSAVGNQNATSGQYLQGMNAGTNTIMAGQNAQINGLSNVAQMQGSFYNSQRGANDAIWGALGQVGGAAASGWLAKSDKNVKKDIKKVDDESALEGVKKTEISKWKYDKDKVTDAEFEMLDDKSHIGGMAQDMKKNLGPEVSNGKMVDLISAVGVNMAATKALAKKVDKLEGKK